MTQLQNHTNTSINAEQFHRDGFHVSRGLFSQTEVTRMRDAFMQQAKDGPVEGLSDIRKDFDPSDPLSRYPRMLHPHQHSDKLVGDMSMRTMLEPRLHPILGALFGEEPFAVQSMFYFKPPGARGQDLHQDNFYLRVKPGTCMGMWLAIDDADRDNGGLVIVPGSGNSDVVCPQKADSKTFFTTEHVPVPDGLKEEPIDLKAGDVLFFNGSVIHGSYPQYEQGPLPPGVHLPLRPRQHEGTFQLVSHPIFLRRPHAQNRRRHGRWTVRNRPTDRRATLKHPRIALIVDEWRSGRVADPRISFI
jgi:phytanoyl-CoA hydroxylase